MTRTLLSNGAPAVPNLMSSSFSLTHTLSRIHTHMRIHGGLKRNSYAVPKEVGKVGIESPTFIEPVQNRKDGIEAMFSRQAKAAQQKRQNASQDAPSVAAAGNSKRKRQPSSPAEEKEKDTTAPSSPAKRSKVKKDPIKIDDAVDPGGDGDVEILPSGPSPSQSQSVRHTFPPVY